MAVEYLKYGVIVALAAGSGLPGPANAGDWNHEARLSVQTSHETNPGLDNNPRKVTLGQVAPTWISNYVGETVSGNASLGSTFVRSSDEVAQPNSVRYDVKTDAQKQFETFDVSGAVNYFRRDFQNTEFNDNELTTDAESASVSENITVDDVTVLTRAQKSFSENVTGFANNTYRLVKFSGGNSTDFTNDTVLSGLTMVRSDKLTITPALGYTRFEPEGRDPTNLYRAQFGADIQPNPTTVLGVTFGGIKAGNETDVSLQASYQQQFEYVTVDAALSRDLSPSDGGELRKQKSFEVGVSHNFSDYTRIRVDAEWKKNDDIEARRTGMNLVHELSQDMRVGFSLDFVRSYSDGLTGEQVTTALRADPFLSWRISEEVDARFSYREIQQDQTGQDRVRSRRVAVVVNYATPFD